MSISEKQLLFFMFGVFPILFFATTGTMYVSPKIESKFSELMIILFLSLLGTILIFILFKFLKVSKYQKDNFHFEVTPEKKCEGWPYMQSSANPELKKYCNKLFSTKEGRNRIKQVSCTNGFVGRPIHLESTPISNNKWQNERCLQTK